MVKVNLMNFSYGGVKKCGSWEYIVVLRIKALVAIL